MLTPGVTSELRKHQNVFAVPPDPLAIYREGGILHQGEGKEGKGRAAFTTSLSTI